MTLSNYIANIVSNTIQSPKVAAAVSTATTASGVGTWFDWIDRDIGTIASIFGIILSLVLIIIHIRKDSRDKKIHDLKVELIIKQLEATPE